MPPEPFPWDRKDFFRERKHHNGYDRVSEPLGPGSVSRWRDSPSHGSRNDFGRCGFPPLEFRRPPGHGKQGGWHLYPDDLPHGYSTARYGDRFYQDGGGFRPSGPYRDGRYNRNLRESRGPFNHKGWRSHSWDYNYHHSMPPSGPGRSYDMKDQKLADGPPARIPHPHSDEANASNQPHSKEHADKPRDVSQSEVSQKIEKEESLASADWKLFNLKWSRSGSLTSRGSSFSLSSGSKSAGESCDVKIELPLKIATPDESSSADAVGCLASPASLDDTTSRKKPRLGWGEGLAKFEKKNVEGPDDCQMKNSSTFCTGSVESMLSPAQHLADQSPGTRSLLECKSPVTPSSAVGTSSPGLDDKSYVKATEIDSAVVMSPSPTSRSQNHFEELSLSPENMEPKSPFNLKELFNELLRSEDQNLIDSDFIKTPAVNKLLLLRGEISKALELTESEIDSLENELKSLNSQPGSTKGCPETLNSMSLNSKEKPCTVLQRPPSLIVSSVDIVSEDKVPCGNITEDAHDEGKDEYADSPGTATSKFMEPLSSDKFHLYDQQKNDLPVETAKYVVCTSVEVRNPAASSSASDTDIKVSKNGGTPGRECLVAFDNVEESLVNSILASNTETATRASSSLSNLLPCSSCAIQNIESVSAGCTQNNLLIKEMFLKRQHSLRFKEKALCLKYRVFQYLWKEDLQLLSERKCRAKSQKKVESGYRSSPGASQKNRSSIRLRITSPACNSSLYSKSEVVSFTGKLLSDPPIRSSRNSLKMPALILDKKEKQLSSFLSNNGLVEDPCALERERALMNPWTAEEKEIFLDKYATFGKDFKKISSFLDHKTIADCVEFYYKNHKSSLFKKTKQKELNKQQKSAPSTRYLMTSAKKWSREMNAAASLNMLGAASAIVVARDDDKEVNSLKIFSTSRKLRLNGRIREFPRSYRIEDERETEAADALASICGSLSSETTISYITSSADPVATQNVDDNACSDESCGYVNDHVDWTDEEKSSFVQAFSSYGKDFVTISRCVRTKSRDQCRVFFGKARKCLGLDELLLCAGRGNEEIPAAATADYDMATCGDRSSDTTDENKPPVNASNIKQNHDVSNPSNLDGVVKLERVPVQLDENVLEGGKLQNFPSIGK